MTDLASQGRLEVDTVVMNPPFGTRRKGADMEFLQIGLKVDTYIIHAVQTLIRLPML